MHGQNHTNLQTSNFSHEFDTNIHWKQRQIPCSLRNYCSFNNMFNLPTRAPTNCLPFQNQTANDEVQKTVFCLRL